jgi:hypothetical protein
MELVPLAGRIFPCSIIFKVDFAFGCTTDFFHFLVSKKRLAIYGCFNVMDINRDKQLQEGFCVIHFSLHRYKGKVEFVTVTQPHNQVIDQVMYVELAGIIVILVLFKDFREDV